MQKRVRLMNNKEDGTDKIIIVGAGIGGTQAALDLVDNNYQVYLIEKNPCDFMLNIDEDFPKKNCSLCTISQNLVAARKHPNFELITNASVIEAKGKPGDFEIKIHKKQDEPFEEKCSLILSEVMDIKNYIAELKPLKILIQKRKISPCEDACPAHVKAQEYIDLISKGRYLESLKVIRERCPLPASIGRVCAHPCEEACNRGKIDEPINICGLKRFVADFVNENIEEEIEFIEEKKEKKVAIVGSGPSGLTVAYHLARRGYPVTIFEKESIAGGTLRIGVPNYRLPSEILDYDIDHIKKYGVEIKLNSPIGAKGRTIKNLLTEYSAIYMGVGLPKSRKLNIEGEDLDNIYEAMDFLKKCSLDEEVTVGKKVLVIGGGDVAMDASRSALRKGAEEVHVAMLESDDIIPAHSWEVAEAKAEGIIFHTSRGPNRFVGENGKVKGLETLLCSSVFDENGRFNPVLEACTEEIIESDTVIVAIGQVADLELSSKDIKMGRGVIVDKKTFQTTMEGVFAGGEIVTGPGSAIEAIATGNKAALVIDHYLKGQDITESSELIPDYDEENIVKIDEMEISERVEKESRNNIELIDPDIRKKNFEDITVEFKEDIALKEANRCLSCGICEECFGSVNKCIGKPIDYEITGNIISLNVGSVILSSDDDWLLCYNLRRNTDYRWKILSPTADIDEDKCIGCGECRKICEFDAIDIVERMIKYNIRRNTANPLMMLIRNKSKVISELCKGCGDCMAVCPVGAIKMKHFSNQKLFSMINQV